jgi:hypothetical protein
MVKRKKKDECPKDLDFSTEKKKSSFKSKLESLTRSQGKKVPITFNVGVALILFFCYLSITFVSLPTYPQLLIVLLPTLYILIRYIKLERDTYDERHS